MGNGSPNTRMRPRASQLAERFQTQAKTRQVVRPSVARLRPDASRLLSGREQSLETCGSLVLLCSLAAAFNLTFQK